MDAAPSRCVGRLMMTDAAQTLDLDRWLLFVKESSSAVSLEAPPQCVKEIVLSGERQVAVTHAGRASVNGCPRDD